MLQICDFRIGVGNPINSVDALHKVAVSIFCFKEGERFAHIGEELGCGGDRFLDNPRIIGHALSPDLRLAGVRPAEQYAQSRAQSDDRHCAVAAIATPC
jgi:hypothetical protein